MLALVLVLAAVAACSSGTSGPAQPSPAERPQAIATPSGPDLSVFRGFVFPIAGACLPESDLLMPNAPREYRAGIHEGVDFYDIDNCVRIEKGTEVVAAKDGVVVRADDRYHALTQSELDTANERIASGRANDFEVMDLFRGRQVWIDHGAGIVTRYAHLSGIAGDVIAGASVRAGEVIGYVGDSGTPESLTAPDTELHLHWELRAGDSFLGEGLPDEEVRALYAGLFEMAER